MAAYKEHYSGGEWRQCRAKEGKCPVHEGDGETVPHISADTKEDLAVKRESTTEQIMQEEGYGRTASFGKPEPKVSSWVKMDRDSFQYVLRGGIPGPLLAMRHDIRKDIQNATTEEEREEALWKADQADQAIERRVAIMDEKPGDYYVREPEEVAGTEFEKDPDDPDYSHLSTRALLHLSDHKAELRDSPSTMDGAQRNRYIHELEEVEEEIRWRIR